MQGVCEKRKRWGRPQGEEKGVGDVSRSSRASWDASKLGNERRNDFASDRLTININNAMSYKSTLLTNSQVQEMCVYLCDLPTSESHLSYHSLSIVNTILWQPESNDPLIRGRSPLSRPCHFSEHPPSCLCNHHVDQPLSIDTRLSRGVMERRAIQNTASLI